jgi:hypothetical protein
MPKLTNGAVTLGLAGSSSTHFSPKGDPAIAASLQKMVDDAEASKDADKIKPTTARSARSSTASTPARSSEGVALCAPRNAASSTRARAGSPRERRTPSRVPRSSFEVIQGLAAGAFERSESLGRHPRRLLGDARRASTLVVSPERTVLCDLRSTNGTTVVRGRAASPARRGASGHRPRERRRGGARYGRRAVTAFRVTLEAPKTTRPWCSAARRGPTRAPRPPSSSAIRARSPALYAAQKRIGAGGRARRGADRRRRRRARPGAERDARDGRLARRRLGGERERGRRVRARDDPRAAIHRGARAAHGARAHRAQRLSQGA